MLKKNELSQQNLRKTVLNHPYYLVLFENRTKLGTVLSETVLSGTPCSMYFIFPRYLKNIHYLQLYEN